MTRPTTRIGPMMTIADLTRLYGVTPRALRFYEERGLISARRDRLNQRYYDSMAHKDVQLIVRLRQVGVGLPEIRRILEVRRAGEPVRERRMIASYLAALRGELDRRLAAIDSAFEEYTGDPRSQVA